MKSGSLLGLLSILSFSSSNVNVAVTSFSSKSLRSTNSNAFSVLFFMLSNFACFSVEPDLGLKCVCKCYQPINKNCRLSRLENK